MGGGAVILERKVAARDAELAASYPLSRLVEINFEIIRKIDRMKVVQVVHASCLDNSLVHSIVPNVVCYLITYEHN